MLGKGAYVNAKDNDGETALMGASDRSNYGAYIEVPHCGRHSEVVKILLDKGADVNAKDNAGYTALIKAAGGDEIVQLLKKAGAKE
ncbi:MAG: ankyrin repeat domain-containing protein [Candidatus Omnitrophota bacterium]|nr:ankyrin repeat domain-containing protein [Candidatus Omnitrophota bacterium]